MSVEAMAWALNVPVGGNQKVVLLGLANHAHRDGTGAYPSLETLSIYAHCDRSTAKRNVHKLRDAGWIVEEGRGPHGQVAYRMAMGAQIAPGGQNAPGQIEPNGGAPVPPEPSIEPPSVDVARTREDAFSRCFSYWQEKTNHPRSRPSPDRRRKFAARLAEGWTEEDIRTAIDGIAARPFVDEAGTKHDGFDLLVQSAKKVELNMARAEGTSNVRPIRPVNTTPAERRQEGGNYLTRNLMREAGLLEDGR